MPSIEELLADLENSEESEETSEETAPAATETSAIKAIRESQKHWEKKARELGKELRTYQSRVTEFESAQRESTVKGVFKELDLPEKQAALFLKTHEGEIDADSIKQWVTDYGLKDLSGETGGTTEDKSQGFQPGGTGGAEAPVAGKMPRSEWLQLGATDPTKAKKILDEGRVDMSDVSFGPR